MQRFLGRFATLVLLATAAVPVQAAGRDEVSTLELELKQAAKEHLPPAEVFTKRQKLGSLYADMGDSRKAEGVWRETVRQFQKGGYDKDGGILASVAAEAAFRLIEPRAKSFVATPIQPAPAKLAVDKQLGFVMKQLQQQLVTVRGSPDLDPESLTEHGAGGLCDELNEQVAIYNSLEWQYAAAVLRARLLGHVAESAAELPVPEGTSPEKLKQLNWLSKMVSERMQQLGLAALEQAWNDAQRRNASNSWVIELKRELNRYRPEQHPLSRERGRIWLEPAPDEATRDAVAKAARLEEVRACFDRKLAAQPDQMLGEVVVHLTVGPQGLLTEIHIDGEGEILEQCVRKRWRDVQNVPHADEGPRQFHVKLQFAAL
jgi:hypothetical protein